MHLKKEITIAGEGFEFVPDFYFNDLVVIVGPMGVGKTTFMKRHLKFKGPQNPEVWEWVGPEFNYPDTLPAGSLIAIDEVPLGILDGGLDTVCKISRGLGHKLILVVQGLSEGQEILLVDYGALFINIPVSNSTKKVEIKDSDIVIVDPLGDPELLKVMGDRVRKIAEEEFQSCSDPEKLLRQLLSGMDMYKRLKKLDEE